MASSAARAAFFTGVEHEDRPRGHDRSFALEGKRAYLLELTHRAYATTVVSQRSLTNETWVWSAANCVSLNSLPHYRLEVMLAERTAIDVVQDLSPQE